MKSAQQSTVPAARKPVRGKGRADGLGTVRRVLALLRLLAENDSGQSVKQIAESLALPSSTVHRLLGQLAEQGFAERELPRLYRAGREFSRLGGLAMQRLDLADIARPSMRKLVATCDETCLLSLYFPASHKLAYIEEIESSRPLRERRVRKFRQQSLAWGASGRAILAWLPRPEIDAVIALAPRSPRTGKAPDAHTLLTELAEIRKRGYVTTQGQLTRGAVGIAVPVFGVEARVIGSLSLLIPTMRFNPRQVQKMAALLKDNARTITTQVCKAAAHARA
jgi:DNA-binding IclR family transcriptional regulator